MVRVNTRRRRWSGRRDSNPRPTAWKAVTLPLSYSRPGAERIDREWWRREDSNLGRAKPGRFTVCCHCPLGHTSEFLDCQRPTVTRRQRIGWSRHSDLNRGPTAYKAVALPLSYAGVTSRGPRSHGSSGADPPPCQGNGIVDGRRVDGKGKRGVGITDPSSGRERTARIENARARSRLSSWRRPSSDRRRPSCRRRTSDRRSCRTSSCSKPRWRM
jgi:hypothetical protein